MAALLEAVVNFHFKHFVVYWSSSSPMPPPSLPALSYPKPTDPSLLLRLSTVLYQQQHSPDPNLHSRLLSLPLPPPSSHHELFLQVCNVFPLSWRPVHRFLLFLLRFHSFSHSPATSAKLLSVLSSSKNVSLLWSTFLSLSSSDDGLTTPLAISITARGLAEAREVKKCAQIIPDRDTLDRVVGTLCDRRMVDVANSVVSKVRARGISPGSTTYRHLVVGFCRAGDLVEASKIWNRMVAEEIEPEPECYEEMLVTFFKNNRLEDAMRMFKSMRERRFCDVGLGSYSVVIDWLSKEGRITFAYMLFGEMLKRGVGVDNSTLGALIYGLFVKRKVREGYKIFDTVEEREISLYHGLIKGLLRIKRAGEATRVFREMIERGCEPTMHTYIMLLQGHLGKRGRKGRDPSVNFESIFVGGLVKAGKTLEATKYVERMMWGGVEVPRFDYNKFLKYYSNDEGVAMFEEVGRRLREVGLVDLGDIFLRYGERMATRDRRRRAMNGLI
ncbi:putative pentatricopeptide repeat-containing protein At1g26500 [Typha latifolia]|uniref:putative pentatricopeptide repeat-containing protein At1g26500 n=1 Tax=Typha latifolia TaxID=4733 RepID=UPI003C2E5D7F